jgi:tRNA modification GTPase
MHADLHDTIVALSSASGPGARAIVRLSGRKARALAQGPFNSSSPVAAHERRCYEGNLVLPDVSAPLPADLYVWPSPRTYTGQEMAELHFISSPPLAELVITQLLSAGARAAQPGEFTLRAFLAGKLDLTRAEAVLAVIEAGTRDELMRALAQLAGGVARPVQELREDLLNLLADVEASLDFSGEDIQFVRQRELLERISKGLAFVTLLRRQLDSRAVGSKAFRVVLAGRPNAGKSSLFNALAGRSAALVSPLPGTTRDYLLVRLEIEGAAVELIDTAGWRPANGSIEKQAQSLAREQAVQADLVLFCLEACKKTDDGELKWLLQNDQRVIALATKCDLAEAEPGRLATSARTGEGLNALRKLLGESARAQASPALAPSLSRCRHHVEAALQHLRQAHAVALNEEPPELLALELRSALEDLGAMAGAVYTDDLLDRIFSRFCIGK